MDENTELYEEALEAIRCLFDDTSVSQEKCKENMKSLTNEIRSLVEALEEL